ncbi:ash family protein [Shewanella sp. SR44-4]|nr:ash family protein [Shewanella sp. SR44-4]
MTNAPKWGDTNWALAKSNVGIRTPLNSRRNCRQPLELVFYCVTRRTTTMVGWVRQPFGWPLP